MSLSYVVSLLRLKGTYKVFKSPILRENCYADQRGLTHCNRRKHKQYCVMWLDLGLPIKVTI